MLQALGLLIAILVVLQAAVTVYSLIRQQRVSRAILNRVLADARARSKEALERDSRRWAQTDLSWTGYRKFEVQRKVVEDGPRQVCSFYLVPHDRRPLPSYRPGQFLTFQLDVDVTRVSCGKCGFVIPPQARFCTKCGWQVPAEATSRGQAGKPTVRCYSLSDWHHADHYRVTIKRLAAPRNRSDLAPGLVSNFFHNSVQEGDILSVMAPSGKFYLDLKSDRPVVLIGGGVGVTPMLSMLNAITETGSPRETWFFYGVRHGGEHIQRDHLERVAREFQNVQLHVCYSNPRGGSAAARVAGLAATVVEKVPAGKRGSEGPDLQGRDYHHAERVSVDLLKRVLPSSNYEFYICGPPPMMTALVEGLESWGVPSEHIHFEAFGPATVKRSPQATQVHATQIVAHTTVTFAKSGKTCEWTKDVESLLELAEQNGVIIDSGCRVGNCNTCLTAIKEGGVALIRDPNTTPEKGSCLTCISVPKGNLVLDA